MEEYNDIAKSFVAKLNAENTIDGYTYDFCRPQEFMEYWYFDLIIIPKIQDEANFGGAPGFVISKVDKKARLVAFGKISKLREQDKIRRKLNQDLIQMRGVDWTAGEIKKHLGAKAKDAIYLKNKYASLDLSKESNRLLIIKELE